MDEWSTQSKSPQKMWEILKKSNPELDEQFFRLPDGRWDTSRLSQGMATINREKEIERKKKSQIELENNLHRQNMKLIKQELSNQEKKRRKKDIDFSKFQLGMAMFILPPIIQFLILLSLSTKPFLSALEALWDLMPIFVVLNFITWISIPIMTSQLAAQIAKLDNRTKTNM